MLSISISVQKRDNVLGTASGIATARTGEGMFKFSFRSTEKALILTGEGGNVTCARNGQNLYVAVASSVSQRATELLLRALEKEMVDLEKQVTKGATAISAKIDDLQ